MKIKTNHKRYIESSEGTIRIDLNEYHHCHNSYNITLNLGFSKLGNKNYAHIGQASFYCYLTSACAFEDIIETDNSQWEYELANKIWDLKKQQFKRNYEKFEDVFHDDIIFSLDNFYLNPKFRGNGMFKKILMDFQKMYPFGTILLKPWPLGLDIDDKKKFTITMKKIRQSYENCEFKPIDSKKEYYYLNIPEKFNVFEKNKNFFKQNIILWNFYNLEHIQEIFEDKQ
jgi:hypothetical protein